jgi:4a-hydroxytetrahydrobiopterin dehydratase
VSDLASRECVPCRGGVPPLPVEEQLALLAQLTPEWHIVNSHHLQRAYRFRNFAAALAFVNRIGELAEQQSHHPDLHLAWGKVGVEIWTHAIDGLLEADFVLAAKCERLFASVPAHERARERTPGA